MLTASKFRGLVIMGPVVFATACSGGSSPATATKSTRGQRRKFKRLLAPRSIARFRTTEKLATRTAYWVHAAASGCSHQNHRQLGAGEGVTPRRPVEWPRRLLHPPGQTRLRSTASPHYDS